MSHRFMVSVDDSIADFLTTAAKKKQQSISGFIADLINEALDIREDYYWSKVAEEAEKEAEGKPTIPAEVLWKELNIL